MANHKVPSMLVRNATPIALVSLTTVLGAACHGRSQAEMPTPKGSVVEGRPYYVTNDSVVESTIPDSVWALLKRAERAAARVDTILVQPDTLTLRVGQIIKLASALTITPRTAAGEPVPDFAPAMEMPSDQLIAELDSLGRLVARRPGRTRLVISAATGLRISERGPRSVVWILVEP